MRFNGFYHNEGKLSRFCFSQEQNNMKTFMVHQKSMKTVKIFSRVTCRYDICLDMLI